MRYSIPLLANAEKWLPYSGRLLQLVDLGAASTVTLQVAKTHSDDRENLGAVSRRFKYGLVAQPFAGLVLTSTINTTVDLIVADDEAGYSASAEVSIDATQLPLPVETRNADDLAAAPSYPGTVAITDAGVQIMAANTNARRVVIRNAGASSVAISRGGAAAAYASTPVVLASGDAYIEERFAGTNQAWYGRCDTAGTATVSVEVWA